MAKLTLALAPLSPWLWQFTLQGALSRRTAVHKLADLTQPHVLPDRKSGAGLRGF